MFQARPWIARDLRDTESSMTASSRTDPVTMQRYDESRLSSVRPLELDWITMMPSSAANAEPRPPKQAGAADDRRRDRVEVDVARAAALGGGREARRPRGCRRSRRTSSTSTNTSTATSCNPPSQVARRHTSCILGVPLRPYERP